MARITVSDNALDWNSLDSQELIQRRRRKRQTVLAGLAIFVASTGVWLSWMASQEQIDSRLTGSWQAADPVAVEATNPVPVIRSSFEFQPNGRFIETIQIRTGTTLNREMNLGWYRVRGDEVLVSNSQPTFSLKIAQTLAAWRQRLWVGAEVQASFDRYRILERSDTHLKLEYTGTRRFPAPTWNLVKVPDAPAPVLPKEEPAAPVEAPATPAASPPAAAADAQPAPAATPTPVEAPAESPKASN